MHNLCNTLDAIRGHNETPIVVLDLDSTLINTSYRHHGILNEFATRWPDALPEGLVRSIDPAEFGWSIGGPLRRRGFHDSEALKALLDYWWTRFFHPDMLRLDRPVAGAVTFAKQAHAAGAFLYYLTARDAPNMGTGTVASLLKLGFPLLRERTLLHLKPHTSVSDAGFKQQAATSIAELGHVVATFENEPGHCNHFIEAFPDAHNILVGSVHSPEAPPSHPSTLRIEDFTLR